MKNLALILLLITALRGNAAHLVGGEISYQCTGNNTYLITLKVYRDCNSTGAPFDPNAYIAIFNGTSGVEYTSVSPVPLSTLQLPTTVSNPCLQTPPNICTEMAIYTASVYLPPSSAGYTITYQRCCRNATITNIPNPGSWGNTYTTRIPPNDQSCNSSPAFMSNPPIVLCLNDSLNMNSSAAEPDGDSLYYELCSPLHGGDQTNPRPVPPTPPPYITLPFAAGYSAGQPIPGNPPFQINPQTGVITGKPGQVGQFVVGICVSEYRNGVLLSRIMRDYQFNVVSCQSNVTASFSNNSLYCTGKSVTFTNASINGTNYSWDFGVANTLADTSRQFSPTFVFPDTGLYTVKLVVNRGWPCSDSITQTVEIRYPANAAFSFSGPQCFGTGAISFQTTSINTIKDTYEWNFGAAASTLSSNLRNPPPVTYNAPGAHVVSLKVNSYGCVTTIYDTVHIYLQPEIDFDVTQSIGCAPFTATFADGSTASTNIIYQWDFGDGNTSNLANPSHTYQNPGVYNVGLVIYITEGCTDTLSLFRPGLVTVNPTPTSGVTITPTITTIYDAVVTVQDLYSKPGELFFTDMGDGSIYSNNPSFIHTYRDTGSYLVKHVVYNGFSCADTAKVLVRINPVPLIFAPNAFSPNGDGDNDEYRISVVGYQEFKLSIFNRWGDRVFYSEDPSESWNGQKYNTGQEQPVGVYTFAVYMRDLNNMVAEERGSITLIR